MKNSVLITFYQINTNAFVHVFCENKNRPQLACNGKCKLAQIVKENEKREASDALATLQAEIFLYYQQPVIEINKDVIEQKKIAYSLSDNNHYFFQYLFRSDKPPQAIA